jgi:hypothetical protein
MHTEDLSFRQFIAELTSVTPIWRIASATVRPCAVSTSVITQALAQSGFR